jgi:hypothetical protein
MSDLLQRHYLACPYQRARTYLEESLRSAASSNQPQILRLRVPIRIGNAQTGDLEKEVTVTYGEGVDPMHFDQPWTVQWSPVGGGPYPDFEGTLTVRADEDYTSSVLELQGTYQPPLGIAGAAFDAVAGSRIASATAREFLATVGRNIEERFKSDEAAKGEKPHVESKQD